MSRIPAFLTCWTALLSASILPGLLWAGDQPQAGQRDSRNMVSAETGLPDHFDPGTRNKDDGIDLPPGSGVKWVARLGNASYGSAVVAGGRVFVGTNNDVPRDPRMQGDRGVLMCFDEKTGELLWQLCLPKLTKIKWADWYYIGITSPPTIEGDRAYLVSNRGEVMCLDVHGMKRRQPRAVHRRRPADGRRWRKTAHSRAPRTPTSSGSTTCPPNWASRRTTAPTARSSSTAICSTSVRPRASSGRTTTCRTRKPRR